MNICPRSGLPVTHTGMHLHLDFLGASHLSDDSYIKQACEDAALATGAVILGSNFHHFGEGCGVTGVILLSSSHLSVHTWSEFGLGCFDVFVCDGDDPLLAIPVLVERFKPTSVKQTLHPRGILS